MKRSGKGIPENLRALAKRGLRVRFSGFWLNETERDRVIADWLDATPAAAAIVKELIYRYATGAAVAAAPQVETEADDRRISEAARILGELDD